MRVVREYRTKRKKVRRPRTWILVNEPRAKYAEKVWGFKRSKGKTAKKFRAERAGVLLYGPMSSRKKKKRRGK